MKFTGTFKDRMDKILLKERLSSIVFFHGKLNTLWLPFYFYFSIHLFFYIWGGVDVKYIVVVFFTHFGLSYLIAASLNNSFALSDKDLFVFKTNFPFKKINKIHLSDIKKAEIANRSKLRFLLFPFCILIDYHLKIHTRNDKIHYFYCIGLEEDYWERETSDNTIDHLGGVLKKKGVQAAFNISD